MFAGFGRVRKKRGGIDRDQTSFGGMHSVAFGDALEVYVASKGAQHTAYLCSSPPPPSTEFDLSISLGRKAVPTDAAACGDERFLHRLPHNPPPLLRAAWLRIDAGGAASALVGAVQTRLLLRAHTIIDGKLLCPGAMFSVPGGGIGGASVALTVVRVGSGGAGKDAPASVGRATSRTQLHIEKSTAAVPPVTTGASKVACPPHPAPLGTSKAATAKTEHAILRPNAFAPAASASTYVATPSSVSGIFAAQRRGYDAVCALLDASRPPRSAALAQWRVRPPSGAASPQISHLP